MIGTEPLLTGTVDSLPASRYQGHPKDVAAATLFLLSSASSWITGATLDVAGGRVMS